MKPSLLLVGFLAAACAGPHPSMVAEPTGTDSAAARADEQRAEQLERVLSELSAASAPPDCPRVCDLVGQICDLSLHICAISGRHRDDAELAARCAAGERRCRRARERAPSVCACTWRD